MGHKLVILAMMVRTLILSLALWNCMDSTVLGHHLEVVDCDTADDCNHGCPCEDNVCNYDECDDYIGCMTSLDCDGCPCGEDHICKYDECPRVGKAFSLLPQYLSVPRFKLCVGYKNIGTSTEVCLPRTKPETCTSESWIELQDQNELGSCEENRDGCMTSEDCDGCPCEYNICVNCGENRDGCMTSEDCDGCPCEHNFCNYDECPSTGVLPPKYLSVPGYQLCIREESVGSSTAVCLPALKPEACTQESWIELSVLSELSQCDENRDGCMTSDDCVGCPCEHNFCNYDQCPSLPPFYLSVPGFQNCLREKNMGTSTAWCLPGSKPEACSAESWTELARNQDELSSCDDKAGDYSPATVEMGIVEFAIGRIGVDDCDYHLVHGRRSVHDFESQVVEGTNYRFVVYVEPYVGPEVGDGCKNLRCEFIVFEPLAGLEGTFVREETCLY